MFRNFKTLKELWAAIEVKFKHMKKGTDWFLALKYFEFKFSDSVSIMDQVRELEILVSQLGELQIQIPDALQVGAILSKLPSSWNDYRKKILHSSETYTIEQFTTHLQIECENRSRDELLNGPNVSKVNHVDVPNQGANPGNSGKNSLKPQRKNFKQSGSSNNVKKNRICFHYGKKGHYIKECRFKNKQKKDSGASSSGNGNGKGKAHMVETGKDEYVAMVTELHMTSMAVSDDWWLDSGATIHVCNNKALFKSYAEVDEPEEVLMGNHNAAKVLGKGSVELDFTSGKKLTLMNVFHVPDLKKNLISANLLCNKGFKIVLEAERVIVSKNGVFLGKGYSCDGMFKLSINKTHAVVAYIVDSLSLWHSRLAHLNYGYLRFMSRNNYIESRNDHEGKCEICVQAKMTRKPFPKVERNSELLKLVHSDICELNG